MPLLTVLATAAQVGQREHAALFQQQHTAGAEAGGEADVEAAVGIQQGGVLAVLLHALFVHDEHGHLGAVLAGIEHLFGDELCGIELQLGTEPHLAFAGGVVVLVNGAGVGEAGETVEAEGVAALAAEAARAADVGQRDLLLVGAIQLHTVESAGGVLQVFGEEQATTGAHALQQLRGLWDDVLPGLLCGVLRVHLHEAVVGRVHLGHHQELARGGHEVDDGRFVVEAGLQRHPLGGRGGDAARAQVVEVHLEAVGAGAHVEGGELLTLSDTRAHVEVAVLRVLPHEHVLLLRVAQLVVVHLLELAGGAKLGALGGGGVAAVEEAVLVPGGPAELAPLQQVGGGLQGGEVVHHDLLPVAAGLLHAHGHVAVVVAGADGAVGGGAGRVQRVGVDEDLVLAIKALAYVDHALVLQAAVLPHEVELANAHGSAHLGEVVQLLVALGEAVAEGDLGQEGIRNGVLGLHPCGGLGACVVLQPAVRVGHPGSVQAVAGGAVLAGLGVGDLLHGCGPFGCGAACRQQQREKGCGLVHSKGCRCLFHGTARRNYPLGSYLRGKEAG